MEQPSVQEWPDQTADRMRASEALYQPLTDNIDLITWVRRRDESPTLCQPINGENWAGHAEPLYEDSSAMLDGIHPDDLPALMEAMSKYRDGGMDETFRILTPSGKIRWLRRAHLPAPRPTRRRRQNRRCSARHH